MCDNNWRLSDANESIASFLVSPVVEHMNTQHLISVLCSVTAMMMRLV